MWPFNVLKRRRERRWAHYQALQDAAERAGLTRRRTIGNHRVLHIKRE